MGKVGGKQIKPAMKKGGDPSPKRVTSERNKIVGASKQKSVPPTATKSSFAPRFIRPTKRG